VVHRGADEGQTEGHRDGALEIHHLGGDVSLIVVQRQHGVERAVQGEMKDRIGGDGTGNVEAELSGLSNRRLQFPRFFIAEQAVLAAVGIQSGHRQSRASNAQGGQGRGAAL
jgi:hypothetical protein